MPPISCLLRGCEQHWLNSREEFMQHCDELHGGYQTYRLRVLHLLSRTVYQFPGSLQRAAMQNFAEFQCRSQTAWQHFTPEMKELMQGESPDADGSSHSGDGQQDATTDPLGRSGRRTPGDGFLAWFAPCNLGRKTCGRSTSLARIVVSQSQKPYKRSCTESPTPKSGIRCRRRSYARPQCSCVGILRN